MLFSGLQVIHLGSARERPPSHLPGWRADPQPPTQKGPSMTRPFGMRAAVLAALLCLFSACALAAETPGKWIRFGKTTVNANQQPTITLLNPIADADEAAVAAKIKEANGPISLTIAVQFSQPPVSFYTLNARVSDPKQAVEASRRATEMYKAIQRFLKSGETYLDLGE